MPGQHQSVLHGQAGKRGPHRVDVFHAPDQGSWIGEFEPETAARSRRPPWNRLGYGANAIHVVDVDVR